MPNAITPDSYHPRVIGKPEPEAKKINLWLGSSIHCKSKCPFCPMCGLSFKPTTPYAIFLDDLHHAICRSCADDLTPRLAGIVALASDDQSKFCRKLSGIIGRSVGVIPYVEAVVFEEPVTEMESFQEAIYVDANCESSNGQEEKAHQ